MARSSASLIGCQQYNVKHDGRQLASANHSKLRKEPGPAVIERTGHQNQDRKETDLLSLPPHSHSGRVLHVQLRVGVALSSGVVHVLQGAARHTVTTPGWGA